MPVLFVGVFMAALDTAVVGPAIPALRAAFGVDNREVGLVMSVFVLFSLCSTAVLTNLSDHYGRRPVYLASVALFALGSLGIAASPHFWMLIASRSAANRTVGEYVQRMRPAILSQMSGPNSQIQNLIERVHGPTITFDGVDITGLTATTIDGSNLAGKSGNNIATIDMIVTCKWHGWVEKNGYDEIEFTFDNKAKSMSAPKYLNSNAAINTDTIDWGDVALNLGAAYIAYEQSQSQSQ